MPELFAALVDLAPCDLPPAAGPLPRMPALERLLARATPLPEPADWRRGALAAAGLAAAPGDLPVGATLAAAAGLPASGTWLLATPVRLVATLTRLRLATTLGPLEPGRAAQFAQRCNAALAGGGFTLHAAGGELLVHADAALTLESSDPAPLTGLEIGAVLPRGPDGARVARLMTEIQMWLYGQSSPIAPDASGPPGPADLPEGGNALWLWGGGRAPLTGAAHWPELESADPFLHAARALAVGASGAAGAAGAGAGRASRDHGGGTRIARIVTWQLDRLAAHERDLTIADQRWFAPLAAALARREYSAATLHLCGRAFRLTPGQRWRLWRRPQPWWVQTA